MGSTSLSAFVEYMTPDEPPAEHHEWMCDQLLEPAERKDILRGAVSMPPGHAKTKFCSKYFPAWWLGRNPRRLYLQGGHSQTFCENTFGKGVRDIVDDPRYSSIFPEVSLHSRSAAAGNWRLSNNVGGYVTKGVGQKLAGYRGHAGGVDDPFGSREDAESEVIRDKVGSWFFADFLTRFLPGSPIFVIATRWHPDDLIGRLERYNKEGKGEPWHIINLDGLIENEEEAARDPLGRDIGGALWPELFTEKFLLEKKATLPARDWFSLYKGKPRVEEGNVVKLQWFRRYDKLPQNKIDSQGNVIERQIKRVTVSVDCANKNTQRANFSVASVWIEGMDGYHYLADVRRKKVEYNELIIFIEDTARDWNATVILVEDKGNGTSYIQQRQGRAPAPIIAITPEAEGNKQFRFDAILPMIEAGEVLFPKQAAWLADFEEEMLAFPDGTNDDQVDSTSQYLGRIRKGKRFGTQKLKGLANKR